MLSKKLKSKITNCGDYKSFCDNKFWQIIFGKLSTENININCSRLEKFLQLSINTLNIFSPTEKKYLRENNIPFMNKFLTSAHTKRSRLRNLYLQNKTDASKIAYIKQWNYCASHLNKTKKVITQILMKKTLQIINNSVGQ